MVFSNFKILQYEDFIHVRAANSLTVKKKKKSFSKLWYKSRNVKAQHKLAHNCEVEKKLNIFFFNLLQIKQKNAVHCSIQAAFFSECIQLSSEVTL